jgi:hypothetical protein
VDQFPPRIVAVAMLKSDNTGSGRMVWLPREDAGIPSQLIELLSVQILLYLLYWDLWNIYQTLKTFIYSSTQQNSLDTRKRQMSKAWFLPIGRQFHGEEG